MSAEGLGIHVKPRFRQIHLNGALLPRESGWPCQPHACLVCWSRFISRSLSPSLSLQYSTVDEDRWGVDAQMHKWFVEIWYPVAPYWLHNYGPLNVEQTCVERNVHWSSHSVCSAVLHWNNSPIIVMLCGRAYNTRGSNPKQKHFFIWICATPENVQHQLVLKENNR